MPSPGAPLPRGDTTTAAPAQSGTVGRVPLAYREGTYTYDIRQMTVITVGADTTRAGQDTLTTAGTLTVSVSGPPEMVSVMGRVDSLAIVSRRDTTNAPRQLIAPVTVDLRAGTDVAAMMPSPDSTTVPPGCDSMEDAARAIARDVHIRIPSGAVVGHQWTDSSSMMLCRGGIPMMATTQSTYEIQGLPASATVQIVRRSRLILSGAGLQGSRRIAVTGDGTSETAFTYDLHAGVFLGSTGQSVLRLRFETIQQTEQVTQHSTAQVRLRPRTP